MRESDKQKRLILPTCSLCSGQESVMVAENDKKGMIMVWPIGGAVGAFCWTCFLWKKEENNVVSSLG